MADIKQIKVGSTTYNIEPVTSYLPLGGGTMDGPLNFKNNTWNTVGDDVYIGDYNEAGSLGIKGANGQTNIGFINQSNGYYIKLASPGVTANRTITMPDDSGTIALTKNIPTPLPANGGNADTLDGKHSSDFYLSSSNITNLPINGGIYWNSYVESSSDGSDAASITVIRDGNGSGGTVLQIKQANDNNDIVNVVAGDLKLNGVSVSTNGHTHDDRYYTESEVNSKLDGKSNTGHTHSSILDAGNSTTTTFAYSKSGLNYGDYTWLAGWNGYELRAVNKSQFATSDHTHDNRYYTESEIDSKLNGKSNTNHTHNYLPVNQYGGVSLSNTLDLSSAANAIKFSSASYYVTNIEAGSIAIPNIGTASAGHTTSISKTFYNYKKGNGSWYVVATVKADSPGQPEVVIAGISTVGPSGINIRVRKIANNSSAGSPTWYVNYIAIKYY